MERRALKRVWIPPSRVAAQPRIHTSPSLPLRELLRDGRPLFECASCGFSHDRGLPMCLWCLWSDVEQARAWVANAPRARALSAPSTVNRPVIATTSTSGTTTIPPCDNASRKPTSMPLHYSNSTMHRASSPYSRPNSSHSHEQRTSIDIASRPSTPDSASATCQPKFAAYVARKTAQRHSMLARISEQASAAAVNVPRPETPPLRAPTPGSIALGVLLPIPGALVVTSRRDSVASQSSAQRRNSSAFSLSSGIGGPSRSSIDTDVARPSIESYRSRRTYRLNLEPHSETEDDHPELDLPSAEKKSDRRFGALLKRVSSAVRRTARETRFFPVTWGRRR